MIGILAVLLILPPGVVGGTGAGWAVPGGDQAQTLAGHLAFQADQWRWPLLSTDRVFAPRSISIALTDSNPLFSLAAKLWTHAMGGPPVNWLGAFMGLCWLMQPVAAVYAARGLGAGVAASLTAAVLAASWPALMVRMGHINLCAHFLLLLALGLAFRRLGRPPSLRRWTVPAGLLLVAVLTHPYLFQLCAAVLGAVAVQSAWRRAPGWWRDALGFGAAGVLAAGSLMVLSGPLGGGDKGFTIFSMNLLSPVVPQMSGVFGLYPVIDATGGQYEGYNWLGAGTILLGVVALLRWRLPRPGALAVVLAGLTLVSLSSVVYAGPIKLLDLGTKPWEDIFGSFRSSGRAFWPVGYALMLGAVAAVGRMDRRWGVPLLLAAAGLQLVDIAPLASGARAAWRTGSGIATPAIPAGTALLTVAPHPGCGTEDGVKARGPVMLLHAVQAGARVGGIGLGRPPPWFNCERYISDALETPLAMGEVRVFFGATVQAALQPALLGGLCAVTDGIVLCGRDVPLAGPAFAAKPPPPEPFAAGWAQASDGTMWSEGPRSSLVLTIPPGGATLHLRLAGVSFNAGGVRPVGVTIGAVAQPGWILPDGAVVDQMIALPAGLVRVAFDTFRPVDPARRSLSGAPVRRAALRVMDIRVE